MKTSTLRYGKHIALAFAAACVIGAAIAAPPGPTSNGEFYYYFDVSWGKTSTRYSNGYALCLPDI
jgi:hypothetical protein